MAKKRGLGKGLSALIPEETNEDLKDMSGEKVIEVSVGEIVANQNQPRQEFEQENLQSLADSIKVHGILQPIIIRNKNGSYEIVAGERRFRAAKMIGLRKVPCIVKEMTDHVSAQLALVENLQREDLNQIEEANAYEQLMREYNITQSELSEVIGKSRTHVTNTLRLLKLSPKVIDMIKTQELSAGHGRALLRLEDLAEQKKWADLAVKKAMSVRNLEAMIKKETSRTVEVIFRDKVETRDPHIKEFEDELMNLFGTKVRVKDKKGKGKIEIDYYNLDDLDRILELLGK
jgi:ParB family chromosome partitioning protein